MHSVRYGMVAFRYLTVFKLHSQMPVSLRVFSNSQNTRRLFIQPMAELRVGMIRFGKAQNALPTPIHRAFVERGYVGRFIDQYIVLIFENDEVFEDLVSQ